MADITATMVRELRDKTGAPMMNCKKALEATDGSMEAAEDHLRKQGLKSAEKKAGRGTSEGRVNAVIAADGKSGSMVSIACETDFVANTPNFGQFMDDMTAHVGANKPANAEGMLAQTWKGGSDTVEGALKLLVGDLGENIQLADCSFMENAGGHVATYIHHNKMVGVLVSVTTEADAEKSAQTLSDLCMHIAFARPEGLTRDGVSSDLVEREKAIYLEEVKNKPAEIQEKIMGGKLNKFFAGKILPEQPWVKDDKISVQKALENALGAGTKIEKFACFLIGQ